MHPTDGMGWSWEQLQATPAYVRRYCSDFINARRQAMNDRAEREARASR